MQLDFILNGERSNYKLTEWPSDLTPLQILFLAVCAENYKAELEKLRDPESQKKQNNPLAINAGDSPETIRRKIELMKGIYG